MIPNDILVSEKTDCGAVHCTFAHTMSDSEQEIVVDEVDSETNDVDSNITIPPPDVSLKEICQKLAARLSNGDTPNSAYTDAYEDEIVKESPLDTNVTSISEDTMILPKADVVLHSSKDR